MEWRGLSVCVLVTTVNPAKTDEPIEMSFGIGRQTRVCQMDRILDMFMGKGTYCWGKC